MTDREICEKAAEIAHREVLKICKKVGLTAEKTLKRIAQGLDAKEIKSHYDTQSGKWSYSRRLIAHKTRLEAAALAVTIHGMKPSEKHDVNVNQPIIVEVVKFADSTSK